MWFGRDSRTDYQCQSTRSGARCRLWMRLRSKRLVSSSALRRLGPFGALSKEAVRTDLEHDLKASDAPRDLSMGKPVRQPGGPAETGDGRRSRRTRRYSYLEQRFPRGCSRESEARTPELDRPGLGGRSGSPSPRTP